MGKRTVPVSDPSGSLLGVGTYYKYKRDPLWTPGRDREGQPDTPYHPKRTAARTERLARYSALRLEGKSKAEAGELIGVHESTARQYEREFQDRQRGESA